MEAKNSVQERLQTAFGSVILKMGANHAAFLYIYIEENREK